MLYANYAREKLHNLTLVKEARGYPCVLLKSKGKNLKDYKIYGNTTQETNNLFDINDFKTLGNPNFQINGNKLTVECSTSNWFYYEFTGLEPSGQYKFSFECSTPVEYWYDDAYYQADIVVVEEGYHSRVFTATDDGMITIYFTNFSEELQTYVISDIRLEKVELALREIMSVGEKSKNLIDVHDYTVSGNIAWTSRFMGDFELEPGTYTISGHYKQVGLEKSTVCISIREYGALTPDYGNAMGTAESGYLTKTFTVPEGSKGCRLYYYSNMSENALETSCSFYDVQIEAGSTATEYEPYGYKIPVISRGKNLLDINDITNASASSIDFHIQPNKISATLIKTVSSDIFFAQIKIDNLKPNTTYSISGKPNNQYGSVVYIYSDKLWGTRITSCDLTGDRSSFDTGNNRSVVIGFYWQFISTCEVGTVLEISDIQLEEVKNLLPYPYVDTTKIVNGITFTDNGDGTITANGTADPSLNADFELTGMFDIRKGMVISSGVTGDSVYTYEVFVNGMDGTLLHSYSNSYADHDFIANRIFIRIRPGVTVNNLVFKPLLAYDTKNTSYEPYIEPIVTNIYLKEPLRKIRDYVDYIDFKNKKVIRTIGEKKFTGTESIGMTTRNGINLFYCYTDEYKKSSYYGFCNYYPNVLTVQDDCFSISDAFYFKDNSFSSVAEFKSWLSTSNLIVDYVAATPKEETIELPNIPTHKGTAIIETATNISPSDIWVKYISK